MLIHLWLPLMKVFLALEQNDHVVGTTLLNYIFLHFELRQPLFVNIWKSMIPGRDAILIPLDLVCVFVL